MSVSGFAFLVQCCSLLAILHVASVSGQCGSATAYQPRTREYWIVIEETEWNYTPQGRNEIKGSSLEDDVFIEENDERIGGTYFKAQYVEYTEGFGEKKTKPEPLAHTGNLGPVIRGVVGDTILVHTLNRATHRYSVHGHGVKFTKEHEGFFHNDGEPEYPGDFLDPGENHTYVWEVAGRSGPSQSDFSTVLWGYHSHVSVTTDVYAGLVGPIVIVDPKFVTNEEQAEAAKPCDVEQEVYLYLSVTDENSGKLFDKNLGKLAAASQEDRAEVLIEDEDFVESNLMHGINGFLYGNMPEIQVKLGQRVRWYLFSFGNEVDFHGVAWHGHTVMNSSGKRLASVFLFPASFEVVDMVPDVLGKWIVECHTHDHLDAGMQQFYNVSP